MHVLVAPDKFRGTLTAVQAARAIGSGWLRERPSDTIEVVPMADGGEGTLETLVDALGGELVPAPVEGPLGDRIDAAFGLARTDQGLTAVVEMARASGLSLVSEGRRDALRASTRGTGQLLKAALARRPARVIVCIGGSATTDGGAGMAQALGAFLVNTEGEPIARGGAGLLELARIDVGPLARIVDDVAFSVASDVDNPLTGPQGAAHVYGPQKGASPDDVVLLDRALAHLAVVVARDLGVDLRDHPGSGAAGGLGFGLMAFCGAHLRPGVDVVMDAVRLHERIGGASYVITGEGRFDAQSLFGKAPAGVLESARAAGVPSAVLCGRAEIDPPDGVTLASLVQTYGEERAMGDTRLALEELAASLAATIADFRE